MIKADNIRTTTYMMGEGYLVDIVEKEGTLEAWLYTAACGIKASMFMAATADMTMEEFLARVEEEFPEYREGYEDEFYC